MIGLTQHVVFAMNTGSCCMKAVIHEASSPQDPAMQTTVNGVQAKVHTPTVIIEILAMRISADMLFWSELLRSEATFIFLACWRSSSSCLKTACTM